MNYISVDPHFIHKRLKTDTTSDVHLKELPGIESLLMLAQAKQSANPISKLLNDDAAPKFKYIESFEAPNCNNDLVPGLTQNQNNGDEDDFDGVVPSAEDNHEVPTFTVESRPAVASAPFRHCKESVTVAQPRPTLTYHNYTTLPPPPMPSFHETRHHLLAPSTVTPVPVVPVVPSSFSLVPCYPSDEQNQEAPTSVRKTTNNPQGYLEELLKVKEKQTSNNPQDFSDELLRDLYTDFRFNSRRANGKFSGRSKTEGEPLYRCPFKGCTKTAKLKANLKAHIRKHTGEMPFACNFNGCQRTFKWRSSLDHHLKSHVVVSPISSVPK